MPAYARDRLARLEELRRQLEEVRRHAEALSREVAEELRREVSTLTSAPKLQESDDVPGERTKTRNGPRQRRTKRVQVG